MINDVGYWSARKYIRAVNFHFIVSVFPVRPERPPHNRIKMLIYEYILSLHRHRRVYGYGQQKIRTKPNSESWRLVTMNGR